MKKPRRNHSAVFKARVALEKTVAEIAAHREMHPNHVTTWKTQALENMAAIFGGALVAIERVPSGTRFRSSVRCPLRLAAGRCSGSKK